MEHDAVKQLMEIKGLGVASARRLVAAGLDDFGKVAAAGEEELRKIRGLNPRSIAQIVAAASARATLAESGDGKAAEAARLSEISARLQEAVAEFAALLSGADEKKRDKKTHARLAREINRVQGLLEQLASRLPARLKRCGKALVKSDRNLAKLGEKGPKQVTKGLKKTRKVLKKALD